MHSLPRFEALKRRQRGGFIANLISFWSEGRPSTFFKLVVWQSQTKVNNFTFYWSYWTDKPFECENYRHGKG